jgi:hypothetical protein
MFAALLTVGLLLQHAQAWGDKGHRIIALIAERCLDPTVHTKLDAMLGGDTDSLTPHDIASESKGADKYRDSDRNGTGERYRRTRQWHFVDIELDRPNLEQACHNHPRLPPGTLASRGPADACIVDKIDQFEAELANPETAPEERLVALKFLLHLVGDVHQPLHAADDHDAGGNKKQVAANGFPANNLHHFWDIEFIARLESDPAETAMRLVAAISDEQRGAWAYGTAADWAIESFALARDRAYGMSQPRGPMVCTRSREPISTARRAMLLCNSVKPGQGSRSCCCHPVAVSLRPPPTHQNNDSRYVHFRAMPALTISRRWQRSLANGRICVEGHTITLSEK